MLSVISLFLYVLILSFTISINSQPCQQTHPSLFKQSQFNNGIANYKAWVYSDFFSVEQLKFECDILVFNESLLLERAQEFYVIFDFRSKKIFDESFDLRPFFARMKFVFFSFYNVEGFDVELNDSLIISSASYDSVSSVFFYYSKFDFYLRGKLIDENLCDLRIFEKINVSLFSGFEFTNVALGEGLGLANPVCPFVFKNARMIGLRIDNVQDTQLYHHQLKFLDIRNENNSTIEMNSKIRTVELSAFYKLFIDSSLFDAYTLQNARILSLNGDILGFETEFFKQFNMLESFNLIPADVRSFFHSSLNEWLAYIFISGTCYANRNMMIMDLSDGDGEYLYMQVSDVFNAYSYLEEDFCLFQYFPQNKAILFDAHSQAENVDETRKLNSCTYKFLSQNNELLRPLDYSNYPETVETFNKSELEKCEFEKRLEMCANTTLVKILDKQAMNTFVKYMDVLYIFEWMEFIGPIVSFSIIALVAFVLNLTVILVITSKENHKEKLFESKLFKYIRMYSVFNCVECFIYQFKLLSICMGPGMIYCSSVRANMFTQYFTITVVGYLSETTKTCSIITGTLFSLQRYIETTKPESRLLENFAQVKMRFVAVFTVVLSLLISVSKVFEYEVYEDIYMGNDLPFSFAIYVYNDRDGLQARTVFYFLHYFLNDFAFLLLNLFIDIKLVLKIKSNLNQKLDFRNKTQESNEKMTKMQKTRLKEELIKKRSVENKANEMIILIVFIYLFCRLPELIGIIYNYFKPYISKFASSCKSSSICYFASNLIEYLYMLSFIFNIILYYKFNSNFRKGFRCFFKIKRKAKFINHQ